MLSLVATTCRISTLHPCLISRRWTTRRRQPLLFVPSPLSPPPLSNGYPVLLHCIFAFCNLRDLTSIVSVSRTWHQAERRLPPLSLSLRRCDAVGSELGRHVSWIVPAVTDATVLSNSMRWCTNLQHLSCAVDPGFRWPQRLRLLQFNVPQSISVGRINELLWSISALPCLERLLLTFPDADRRIRFACFAAHPSLRFLSIEWKEDVDYVRLFPEQIADVRSLSVAQFNLHSISTKVLAALLEPPVSLPWTDLYLPSTCVLDLQTASLLRSLPALTSLRVQEILRHRFIDFLQFTRSSSPSTGSTFGGWTRKCQRCSSH